MAITFPSLASGKATVAGYFQTLLPGWDLSSRGAFGKVKSAITLSLYSFLSTARQIDRDAVPTASTSTDGLDEWATNGTGISDGNGGYGRKSAIAATGGAGTFTGASGTVYPASGTLTASDGVTKFLITSTVTIRSGGISSGNIIATTTGTAGNLEAGAVLTVDSVPVGGDSSVTLVTGTTGGLEREGDAAVLARIQSRLRNPPKGGTAHDYKVWAEDDSGAEGITAYVYERRHGTGTVDTVITQAGTGTARGFNGLTSGVTQNAVSGYISTVRPVAVEGAYILIPTMASGEGVTVRCRVTPAAGFAFDYDDTVGSYPTVISGAMASGLRIAGRPASGMQVGDRIQVGNTATGAPALPEQRIVTAIDLATISGNTILALSSGLTVYPNSGDQVYAGGPVVEAVASGILGLIDSLGPSKAGGYASSSDDWEDTLRVDQIIRVALNTSTATSGRMLKDFVTDPTINGAATNVQPTDTGSNPPGMLWLRRLNVTQ